ncbi:MAG TPA: MFS transporter [Candidatus Eisenbergiella intestinipullorum]|nr:MFS transporter [Candidatus Eisenbergiella intestinipullorum]
MKFQLTKLEKSWILYDIGNSAFTLMVSTIIPIYFNSLAESAGISSVDYLASWGYAASIATLLVVLSGPVLGTLADQKGYKKKLFLAALLLGVICCVLLGFVHDWLFFLVLFVIARVGYSVSLIFYDSMLPDVSSPERVDRVSSYGYGLGYIGSCIPFAACLVLVLGADAFGLTLSSAMLLAFLIVAVWWFAVSCPLLKLYRQKHYSESGTRSAVAGSFQRLGNTFRSIKKEKKTFLFLLAFFFYIDGVYAIIDMATAYGTALGLDTTGLLIALLVTQIVAFPFSFLFGRLSGKHAPEKLIMICILAYLGITVFALFMSTQLHFWILAVCVGMFQGGIQALSRSYFTKIIPAERSGEYFGIMDICGKGASFIGTTLIGIVSQLTGSVNRGIGVLIITFAVGLVLFARASSLKDA